MNPFRTLLLIMAVAFALATLGAPAAQAATFADVSEDAWFFEAVDVLSEDGVVQGYTDRTFRPYERLTRAQFAAMLARAVEPPPADSEPFTDVADTAWHRDPIARLYAAGLLKGTSATTFSPNEHVSRQQMATLTMKALEYARGDERDPVGGFLWPREQAEPWLQGFRDRPFIAQAHRAAVGSAVRLEILKGYADQRFYPLIALTRAQAAGVLYRTLYQPLSNQTSLPQAVPAEESYPVQSVGSEGPLVSLLELRLDEMLYRTGAADGVFDEKTASAVMAFQKVNGLTRDGRAGEEVWTALLTASTPDTRYSWPGDYVEIDLTRQVLFLIQDGALAKILPVSSGAAGWRTPTGHFRILRKIPRWRESPLGLLYKPAYFYGGIAIHGSSSVPPYPASHGCVRVPLWEMDPLYPELPIGMSVYVYY